MDKIIARHLTADLYGCKENRLADKENLSVKVAALFEEHGFHVLSESTIDIDEDHAALLMLFAEGHFAIHLYKNLAYVAADLFLCEFAAAPEDLLQKIKGIFKPEKFRTTYLKRGDFSVSGADMKPQTKTRVAPLRRIHNTGAKVIRLLAHRKH
ncbi:MAG: S-adenosylmethionine decarboxylase [Schwartzia sp.]|nr:S-adenosylmethionine decarboxylase [Schwartzia sp. (in: firmicutes)]